MKGKNKKLKIIFFILLGISIILLTVILFTDTSSYKAILEDSPKVDNIIYEEWGDKEFSVSEIGK